MISGIVHVRRHHEPWASIVIRPEIVANFVREDQIVECGADMLSRSERITGIETNDSEVSEPNDTGVEILP